MPNPNNTAAQGVGQDKPTKDMSQEYDSRHGTYSDDRNASGKTQSPGPGTLPNTPQPMKTTGG